MKKSLLLLFVLLLTICNISAQLSGKFCDGMNRSSLSFIADDLVLVEFCCPLSGGHRAECGFAKYEIQGDSIKMKYLNNERYFVGKTQGTESDSVSIIFVDRYPYPFDLVYNKEVKPYDSSLLYKEKKDGVEYLSFKVRKEKSDLILTQKYKGQVTVKIPGSIITDKVVERIFVFPQENSILRMKDAFRIDVIDASSLKINDMILSKDNCNKKPFPIK